MKKQKWSLLAMIFAVLFVLAACTEDKEEAGKDTDTGTKDGETATEETSTDANFPLKVDNEGTAIDGGTLMVAMQKDEPFQGIFSYSLYEDAYDGHLMDKFASNQIFSTDSNFLFTDKGIATYEVTKQAEEGTEGENIVTVKIRDGVKWSDGEPLKIEDLILPYEIVGHPDYDGLRYDDDFQNIIGATEYHDGTAETISGVVKVDESTYELHLKEISPGLASGGDGIMYYAEPSHIIGDIPVAELVESDAVRKNPVTLGAFVVDKIVAGESVQYKANENYWKGRPKIDSVIVKVVPSTSIAKALESGEYDLTLSLGSAKYAEIENLTNIEILGRPELYYSYLGFKLGKLDTATSSIVTDLEGAKMGDVNLRKAMAYALNVEEVTTAFYDGLRTRANSIIPPVFESFYDKNLEGFNYDPEKAMALLDEAGFKDVDGDDIREDKEGQPLEINFATMSGDDVAEQISAFWLQNWKEIGLNVVYTDGRTIEFNSFYEKVQADDPGIDIFMAAWGVGTNPSPSGVYGKGAANNFARYTTEELATTLDNIDSAKSFDPAYRSEQFGVFEKIMAENVPVVPMMNRLELTAVNKRVKHFTVDYADVDFEWSQVELTADAPIK